MITRITPGRIILLDNTLVTMGKKAVLFGICVVILLSSCSRITPGRTSDYSGGSSSNGSDIFVSSALSSADLMPEDSSETLAEVSTSAAENKETEQIAQKAETEIQPDNKYRMNLTLDPVNNTVGGTETVFVQNNSEDIWNELCFRDYPSLFTQGGGSGYDSRGAVTEIDNMKDLTNNADMPITRDEADISIVFASLPVPLNPGERLAVEFEFAVFVPELESRFGYHDKVFNLANFYPVLAVYENGGWVTEKYFSLGECFYSVVSDYEIFFSVPASYTLISSGQAVMNSITPQTVEWYISAENVRDFTVVAGEGFEVVSESVGDVAVNSFYLYDDRSKGEIALQAGVSAVKVFNESFGEYPYPELDIVETYLDAAGMEYPNLVMISDTLTHSTTIGNTDLSWLETVVVHEVAHQWFYGLVGDNQYKEAWLDESFASFSEWVYMESFLDEEIIEDDVNELEASLEPEGNTFSEDYYRVDRSYDTFDSDHEYTDTVYQRGSVFLYRLREAMGRELFLSALQEYVSEYSFKAASTEDFADVIIRYAEGNTDVGKLLNKYLGWE